LLILEKLTSHGCLIIPIVSVIYQFCNILQFAGVLLIDVFVRDTSLIPSPEEVLAWCCAIRAANATVKQVIIPAYGLKYYLSLSTVGFLSVMQLFAVLVRLLDKCLR
jgi:hypothetical protein